MVEPAPPPLELASDSAAAGIRESEPLLVDDFLGFCLAITEVSCGQFG
jgi:hypothetical protein